MTPFVSAIPFFPKSMILLGKYLDFRDAIRQGADSDALIDAQYDRIPPLKTMADCALYPAP